MTTNIKHYLAWTFRVIIALLFIVSAIAKLSKGEILDSPYFAISTFEVKQLYPMGFSESFAPFFSRILIGIELALGFLILQNNFLKSFIIPVTTAMLLVFIGHLTYVTFLSGGNSGNCGCFGELIPMTPIEAIIKNIVAVGFLVWLYFLLPKIVPNGNFWILTTVLFASILLLFMMAPIQPPVDESQFEIVTEAEAEPVATDTIDTTTTLISPVKTIDTVKDEKPKVIVDEPAKKASGYASYFPGIDKGKKVLCFFVPGCDHCRDAAKELAEMKKKDKNFPDIKVIFMNEEPEKLPEFFQYAGMEFPYKIIEIIPFWKVLGNARDTPGVKYLWNGNEYVYYDGIGENKFNPAAFEKLVKKPFSELKK